MQLLWVASLSLFVVTIIRRHGWEYVPLVVLLGVARWYTDTRQYGGALADGFFLASIAAVWMVTRVAREHPSGADTVF